MSTIWIIALKDLRLLLRDRLSLFFVLGFPIINALVFGKIGASMGGEPEEHSVIVGLVDQDGSAQSRQFTAELGKQSALQVTTMPSSDEAVAKVRKGLATAFVEIPAGFGKTAGIFWGDSPALKVGVDPSHKAEGGMIEGYIMQAMGALIGQRFMDPAAMKDQVRRSAEDLDASKTLSAPQRLALKGLFATVDQFLGSIDPLVDQLREADPNGKGGSVAGLRLANVEHVDVTRAQPAAAQTITDKIRSPWDISFPSAMLWGVAGCVAGFAGSVARERSGGTFFRLQVAPIARTYILAGKALACFLAVIGSLSVLLVLGLCLGIQLARPDLFILAAICVALGFVGLMMLMSVIGRTEQAVSGGGWAIIVVMCMFGGGMIPLAFMPGFMRSVSIFSPVRWGIQALEGTIWRDYSFVEMLGPCAVLLAIGAVGFALGARRLARMDS